MLESRRCRLCDGVVASRTIPVRLPGQRFEAWHICNDCWLLLELGLRRVTPDSTLASSLDGPGVRLTEPQLRNLIEVALRSDADIPVTPEARRELERRLLVRNQLRGIDGDLRAAMEASARGDWSATLDAVRMIHGRAVVTRRSLERVFGSSVAADLPPIVRAVQAVGRLISDREADTLTAVELRARMHAVLRALDQELQSFLDPPDDAPIQADHDRDLPPGGRSALEGP